MKTRILGFVAALALIASNALACNPWISPTDTACAGMVVGVTPSAGVWVPNVMTVTPTDAQVVTGTIAINSAGTPCVVSSTTGTTASWVKLISPGVTCNFVPPTVR